MNRFAFPYRALFAAGALAVLLTGCDAARAVTEPEQEIHRPRRSEAADTTNQVISDGGGMVGSGHLTEIAEDTIPGTSEHRGGGTVGSGH